MVRRTLPATPCRDVRRALTRSTRRAPRELPASCRRRWGTPPGCHPLGQPARERVEQRQGRNVRCRRYHITSLIRSDNLKAPTSLLAIHRWPEMAGRSAYTVSFVASESPGVLWSTTSQLRRPSVVWPRALGPCTRPLAGSNTAVRGRP
jgi:hypothetical protein